MNREVELEPSELVSVNSLGGLKQEALTNPWKKAFLLPPEGLTARLTLIIPKPKARRQMEAHIPYNNIF